MGFLCTVVLVVLAVVAVVHTECACLWWKIAYTVQHLFFCVKNYATISAVMGHRPPLVVKLPYISHGSVITHV